LSVHDIFKVHHMKRIIIAAVLSCITQISFSQSYKQEYAQKLSNQFNYVEAYPVWVELVNESIELNKLDVASLRSCIAAAYGSEQYVEALKWSDMLLAKSKEVVEADVLLHLQILLLNKKYDAIKQQLNVFAPLFPASVELQKWKSNVDQLPAILERKSQYDVTLFRSVDIGEEFSAVPFEEGVLLVTTGQNSGFVNRVYGKTGQFFTDLVYVKVAGGKQTKEVIWNDIKRTNPHDGPISFSSNNRYAFLTTNQDVLDEKNRIKYNRLELEVFEKERDEWIKRDFFTWNSNTYSTGHGTVDDTLNLYFVSDMPGGFGGTDIYVCKWNGSGYEAPKNLGSSVNSSGNELFPYVSLDGTLYFASNGWLGYGGLDVFTWDFVSNTPENMGSPVNSNADDFSFNVNEIAGKGFVSSNRTNWKDEVFVVNAKMQKRYVDIELKDCQNKPFAQQKVTLYKKDGTYFKTLVSDDYGRMSYIGVIGEQYHLSFKDPITRLMDSVTFTNELDASQTIRLFARPKNQKSTLTVFNSSNIPLDGALVRLYQNGKEIKKQITKKDGKVLFDGQTVDSFSITAINYKEYLMKMPEDKKCDTLISLECSMKLNTGNAFINLDQVLYDYNKWDLRSESIVELDKLVKYMKSNDLKVELSSHTDSRGEDVYNEWLSQQRSNSCVNYIISKGISPTRIIAKGYGEYRLKNRCANDVECTDAEHQQNRRTELRIISE
jgi:outer membrane protein OmpA-like peptidoglycan-associated protein